MDGMMDGGRNGGWTESKILETGRQRKLDGMVTEERRFVVKNDSL